MTPAKTAKCRSGIVDATVFGKLATSDQAGSITLTTSERLRCPPSGNRTHRAGSSLELVNFSVARFRRTSRRCFSAAIVQDPRSAPLQVDVKSVLRGVPLTATLLLLNLDRVRANASGTHSGIGIRSTNVLRMKPDAHHPPSHPAKDS